MPAAPSPPSPAAVTTALRRAVRLAAPPPAGAASPEAALETAVELLCDLTGWPVGHVVLPTPGAAGGGPLRDSNIWHLADGADGADGEDRDGLRAALGGPLAAAEPGPLPDGPGPDAPTAAGRAVAAGGPAWAPLGRDETAVGPVRAALAAAGLRGAFAFPVLVDGDGAGGDGAGGEPAGGEPAGGGHGDARGRVAAVCEFFTPDPPPAGTEASGANPALPDELLAVVRAVASQVGAVLARTRTAAALRERGAALEDLFETAAAGLVLLEPDGTVRRANRAFAHALGFAPGDLAGRPVSDLLAPGGRGGGPLLAAARSGRPLLGHEADFRAAGGAVRTLLIDADARLPPDPPGPGEAPPEPRRPAVHPGAAHGDAAALLAGPVLRCFTRDVTARHRREQDRNRLAEIVRATPDAVSSKDLNGIIQTWNEGAVRTYGFPADRAIGKTAADLGVVSRERWEEDRQLMAIAVAGRRVEQFETKRVTADGKRIDVSLTVGPIRDAAGRVVGAAFVARDITDQKRAAEKLERATSRAEQASRAKTEFLANVSHELRTPMSAILGFTELAADEPLPPHVLEWLGTVRESADHLLALLNEILDFSRIESRRFELEPVPFAPREVVEETVRSLARRADAKGLELTGRVTADLPEALLGDPVRFRQILTNLAGNAVKFTERGRVAVRVEPHPDHAPPPRKADGHPEPGTPVRVLVTVRDTGPGIAAADRERVFQPFAQADNTATRKYGGTGLGLSITRRLVDLMGGTLRMDSVSEEDLADGGVPERPDRDGDGGGNGGGNGGGSPPGTGTTFTLSLTFPAADPKGVASAGADLSPRLAPRLKGLPVLVADGSAENRRLLCEALESWQMTPVPVATAAEGHARLADAAARGEAFPLVLADASLAGLPAGPHADGGGEPGGDEDGLVGRAAAAGGRGVVLVTADGRRRRRAELDAPGVAGAVEKPIARSELLDTIVAALGAEPLRDAEPGRPRSVTPAAAAARLRVLLVEDTAANRKVLSAVLGKRGHAVTLAVNGRAGVDTFVRSLDDPPDGEPGERFDAVLMDVQMPVLDGLRATAELRALEADRGLPRTPILALTAHALRGDRERCLDAGMDGYLSKPIDVHELIGTLERHARRARRDAAALTRRRTREAGKSPAARRFAPEAPAPAAAPVEPAAAVEPEGEGPAVFDRSAALARMGGDAGLLAEVAGLFAEDAPPLCRAFAEAAESGDADGARVAAHTLKGICATLGGERAKAAAFHAEQAAAAHVEAALMTGRDASALPPADTADLPAAGAALTAAVQALAAALAADSPP